MYILHKQLDIIGLRYPKIFEFNNKIYLLGSKKYNQKGNITKYAIFLSELDNDFNLLKPTCKFIKIDVLIKKSWKLYKKIKKILIIG